MLGLKLNHVSKRGPGNIAAVWSVLSDWVEWKLVHLKLVKLSNEFLVWNTSIFSWRQWGHNSYDFTKKHDMNQAKRNRSKRRGYSMGYTSNNTPWKKTTLFYTPFLLFLLQPKIVIRIIHPVRRMYTTRWVIMMYLYFGVFTNTHLFCSTSCNLWCTTDPPLIQPVLYASTIQ